MKIDSNVMGDRFCEFRRKAQKNQEETAKYLGIPRSAISKIESGDRRLSAIEVAASAEFFGVKPEDFYRISVATKCVAADRKDEKFDYNKVPFTC